MLALILTLATLPMHIGSSAPLQVPDVGRDDEPAAGDFVSDYFGRELFALGDEAHSVGDFSLTRVMHLRACFHD